MKWMLVVLAACDAGTPKAPPVPVKPPHTVMLTFTRTMCYGTCPSYTITVYRDGELAYHGDRFVKLTGDVKATITAAQVAAIDRLFATHDVPNKSFERYDITDNPSAEFVYTAPDGKQLAVKHYFGDTSAPDVLGVVERGIDDAVKIETWIGTREERDRL